MTAIETVINPTLRILYKRPTVRTGHVLCQLLNTFCNNVRHKTIQLFQILRNAYFLTIVLFNKKRKTKSVDEFAINISISKIRTSLVSANTTQSMGKRTVDHL